MKRYFKYQYYSALVALFGILLIFSCKKSTLDEKPQNFFSSANAFTNAQTFQLSINALYANARNYISGGLPEYYGRDYLRMGTDEAAMGNLSRPDVMIDFTLFNSNQKPVVYFWDQSYTAMITPANIVIDRADLPSATWTSAAQKNNIVAQAKFFRAYAYYTLVNLFGDVPLIKQEITTAQFNFKRSPKDSVLNFIRQDLEFAAQNLPANPSMLTDGALSSAAAEILLSTVYLQLNMPAQAVASTSRVINSGYYRLVTQRFGSDPTHSGHFPAGGGDAYSDIFWENNANRSGGNMESIWVIQNANNLNGGAALPAATDGQSRSWGPYYGGLTAPDGKPAMLLADSLGGRPVGFVRTTNYTNYDIWRNDLNDIRNSQWNLRRTWYYNNPATSFYGQKIDFKTPGLVDTLYNIAPMFRKVEGVITNIGGSITPNKKFIVYRFSEAFLLRAEAYLALNQTGNAATDLNLVRARANAPLITASDVNIDFILDERARELIFEEPRRLTLNRLGLWYQRTLKYSLNEPKFYYKIAATIMPFNALWPIPQTAIDATKGLIQNPGY